jgi:IS1 family transposase
MVNIGKENQIMGYLKKNLLKEFNFGDREQEKASDILEKLKESKASILEKYLKRNFKFKKPETKD